MALFDTTQTITTDQTPASGMAVQFNADDITLTIDTDILVVSLDSQAVFSSQIGSALINNGDILSAAVNGVWLMGDSSSVVNNAGRSIIGLNNGVRLDGDGATLENHGNIGSLGLSGVVFFETSDNVALNNDGDIFGRDAGVVIASDQDGGVVENSGTIRSAGDGLRISTDAGLTTLINNMAGGLIQGGNTAILTTPFTGAISLNNHGTVSGGIDCNAGNQSDVVTNSGNITGEVHLGSGNDVFNGSSGTSGKVFGEDGDDNLTGSTHNDQIDGGAGLDLLNGGRGKDLLTGGTDRDIFDFNSIRDSVRGSNRDQILDFNHGQGDKIDLKTIDAQKGGGNQAFHFIGKQGFHDVKGELRYIDKGASCIVQGDVNGDGKADFEIFVHVGSLAKGDFLL